VFATACLGSHISAPPVAAEVEQTKAHRGGSEALRVERDDAASKRTSLAYTRRQVECGIPKEIVSSSIRPGPQAYFPLHGMNTFLQVISAHFVTQQ